MGSNKGKICELIQNSIKIIVLVQNELKMNGNGWRMTGDTCPENSKSIRNHFGILDFPSLGCFWTDGRTDWRAGGQTGGRAGGKSLKFQL